MYRLFLAVFLYVAILVVALEYSITICLWVTTYHVICKNLNKGILLVLPGLCAIVVIHCAFTYFIKYNYYIASILNNYKGGKSYTFTHIVTISGVLQSLVYVQIFT